MNRVYNLPTFLIHLSTDLQGEEKSQCTTSVMMKNIFCHLIYLFFSGSNLFGVEGGILAGGVELRGRIAWKKLIKLTNRIFMSLQLWFNTLCIRFAQKMSANMYLKRRQIGSRHGPTMTTFLWIVLQTVDSTQTYHFYLKVLRIMSHDIFTQESMFVVVTWLCLSSIISFTFISIFSWNSSLLLPYLNVRWSWLNFYYRLKYDISIVCNFWISRLPMLR